MGFSKRLTRGYAAPALGFVAMLTLLAWLLPRAGFVADKVLIALAALACLWALWSRTQRTNRALARFVGALRHRDLAQSFRTQGAGAGLDELGAALDDALKHLRDERLASTAENRFAAALVDEAPTPLLAVDGQGRVTLANKAARRLFQASDGRLAGEFAIYGADFAAAIAEMAPGTRRVCRVLWNGLAQRAVLAASLVDRLGQPCRVIAVHIIQGELDAAELTTQRDLVRVLTHEIMNSLTPVTSLAASAARLVARVDEGDMDAIASARLAIDTLSRRAAGLSNFVESYRAFSRSPAIAIRRFAATPWAQELTRSFAATPQGEGVAVTLAVEPEGLEMMADPDLLGQVVLNLLKNGGEAAKEGSDQPALDIRIWRSDADRVHLTVTDNGAGVPEASREDIFLPFFTSKPHGTGVGLSFARQIVLLHKGAIGLSSPGDGARDAGARFEIVL
jgi:nitrogen fixation/metabolism regulation signal transduction histidine kinase